MLMRLKTCMGALGLAGLFILFALVALVAPGIVRGAVNDGIRKSAGEMRQKEKT